MRQSPAVPALVAGLAGALADLDLPADERLRLADNPNTTLVLPEMDRASLDVAVMLRAGAELADVTKANPFPDALDTPGWTRPRKRHTVPALADQTAS